MRSILLRLMTLTGWFLFLSGTGRAQNCIPTNINGTVFNFVCNQVCADLNFQIPHIKSSSDYTLQTVPYTPYPYTSAFGIEDPNLYNDDEYSFLINLPFPVCFYGDIYNTGVVGSNGLITFDPVNASCANAWPITQTIPFAGGSPCNAGSTYYPRASIMGAYSDLDPRTIASPSDRKISWYTVGSAPCRKFIVSYYHIGVFGNNSCGQSTPNTFQMVMHESTGIVEIFFEQKACSSSTNGGRAILGIQNWGQNQAIAAPGKNNSVWNETNTGYRYVPSAGFSRYVIAELLDMSANVVATADTSTSTPGLLDVRFPSFCSPPGSNQFVVRTTFSACDNPANRLVSLDTITINRTNSLNATATTVAATCGPPNGQITVTVPAGVGTPPYTFVLDGGTPVVAPSPYTFMNVAAGPHTIVVTDFSGGCTSTVNVTVNLNGTIPATTSTTPTSCSGVNDGSITITSAGGTGPYTFSLDGGAPVAGTIPFTFSNLAAGNHTILVNDIGLGCSTILMNVNVPAGIGITGSISSTATSCPGAANGTITATVLSGIAPFTWQLDGNPPVPGASPFTFINVAAGPHVIRITDNLGCIAFFNANVAAGPGINGTAVSTPTSCPAVSNGTITATALTGTAPFTWQLDGGAVVAGASPYTFTNVPAGLHAVTIIDNIGCNTVVTVTVNAGTGITGNAVSTATSCPAATNGTITATALTGTAPFTWQLDGGAIVPGASPYTFINVSAGLHSVTITDNAGCSVVVGITVNAGAGITGNAVSTPTSCPAVSNGTITATALTGTAPFTWQLDGGAIVPGTSPYTFINVSAGLHNVTITDNAGCNVVVGITVNAGAGITANLSSTATACAGVSNGTITVDATTGTAPYTYQLDGGAPQNGANPYTFTNVSAGLHTITVTDNVGCSFTNTETVAVGPGVSGTVTSTPTSCPTALNGSITADATAGTAPFTYSLDGGAPQNGANPYTFINVAAGAHIVTLTDNFGCSNAINVIVVAGPPLDATVVSGATSCSGASNGTITVTPNNGSAPYTFALDGGAPVAGAAPYTFINVAAGNHTVVVTDGAGCATVSIAVVVSAGPVLTTTVAVTDVLCRGGSTGIITIAQPSIGTAPYEYSLDGIVWQFSNIFSGLAAGPYTAYYRESNGCQGNQPVSIGEPAALTAAAAMIPVICNGQNNGTITITTGGGISPYDYSIDGGASWQSSNIFTVIAGNYTITIRDANNCTTQQSITVTEPAALTANSINTTASCDGGNDGTINVTANGGNPGYQYSIDAVNFQVSNIFNVAPGIYTVTVKDNLGCTTFFNTTVTLMGNLTYTQQIDPTICEGKSTPLQLISNATSYAWTPKAGLSDTTVFNPVANPIVTTQYVVTATLGRCSVNDTVIVNVNSAPIPDAGPAGFICYGQTYTLQGSGGTQYAWTPSNYLNNVSLPNPVSAPLKTITYTLSIISDVNGCNSLVTDNVIVDVTPPIKVTTFPYDTIGYPMDQFQLNATSLATNYSWTPTTGLSNSTIPNPVVTIGNIGDDVVYQVTASTNAGCKGEGYVRIRVYKGPDIYVPSAFTPNGDGKNDKFYPFPVGIKAISYFRVFNRWGQLVFSTVRLNDGWDGKIGGTDQPSGTYVWMAQAITKDNKMITKKGTVTLIR
ncbi:MAG: gliding motility-associated C-terminal domain-containing protein [Chitinophagaceae bacterium]|nr:gliding motility-associated C-terminal domain-containing protein [Chitinophagaceae bacterium]